MAYKQSLWVLQVSEAQTDLSTTVVVLSIQQPNQSGIYCQLFWQFGHTEKKDNMGEQQQQQQEYTDNYIYNSSTENTENISITKKMRSLTETWMFI